LARKLKFKHGADQFSYTIQKLDRSKLYGWKETVALDSDNNECVKVTVDDTGSAIIPKGGMALGMIDDSGEWVEKSELEAVYEDGKPAELVPSSFDNPVELNKTVTLEEFLDHSISYVYLLENGDNDKLPEIIKSSKEIYTFTFNYRTDYEGLDAFIMENDGALFILAGYKSDFEFIGLEEVSDVNTEEEDIDDMDFGMM
jgi:hypothetical protein